jgi:hypothetical protein
VLVLLRLALVLLSLDVLLDVLQLLRALCYAQVLLPLVRPTFDQVLQQSAETGKGLLHVGLVDEGEEVEVLVGAEVAELVEEGLVGRVGDFEYLLDVVPDGLVAVDGLFLFLFVEGVVGLADVLDELDDGLEVVVVDAVLDVFVVDEGVEVVEERLEELGDAVLDDALLEHLADDQFGEELHVAQDALLELFQEQLFVLR